MTLRTIAIDQVLNTDMKKHFSVLSRFQVRQNYTVSQPHGMLQNALRTTCIHVSPQNYSQEEICLNYSLRLQLMLGHTHETCYDM